MPKVTCSLARRTSVFAIILAYLFTVALVDPPARFLEEIAPVVYGVLGVLSMVGIGSLLFSRIRGIDIGLLGWASIFSIAIYMLVSLYLLLPPYHCGSLTGSQACSLQEYVFGPGFGFRFSIVVLYLLFLGPITLLLLFGSFLVEWFRRSKFDETQ